MTAATLATATSAENRKAVIAGTIGNVLEWYDFGVYGYLATTMSQLFFPGEDKTISLLKAFAVFGVGFVMRPVGSVVFGIYGDRFGRRLALSAVIFLMAFSTVAIGLLPTYAQAGVLAPMLLVFFRLLQGLSAGGEWGGLSPRGAGQVAGWCQEVRRHGSGGRAHRDHRSWRPSSSRSSSPAWRRLASPRAARLLTVPSGMLSKRAVSSSVWSSR